MGMKKATFAKVPEEMLQDIASIRDEMLSKAKAEVYKLLAENPGYEFSHFEFIEPKDFPTDMVSLDIYLKPKRFGSFTTIKGNLDA